MALLAAHLMAKPTSRAWSAESPWLKHGWEAKFVSGD